MRKYIRLSAFFIGCYWPLKHWVSDSDPNKEIILLKNAKFNKQKSPALKLEIWRNQFHRSPRKQRDWLHLEITEAYDSSGSAICCHVANFTWRLFMDRERWREDLGRYIVSSKLYKKINKQDWEASRQKLLRREIGKATSDILLGFY